MPDFSPSDVPPEASGKRYPDSHKQRGSLTRGDECRRIIGIASEDYDAVYPDLRAT
jgi:hypothetical protein